MKILPFVLFHTTPEPVVLSGWYENCGKNCPRFLYPPVNSTGSGGPWLFMTISAIDRNFWRHIDGCFNLCSLKEWKIIIWPIVRSVFVDPYFGIAGKRNQKVIVIFRICSCFKIIFLCFIHAARKDFDVLFFFLVGHFFRPRLVKATFRRISPLRPLIT